MTHITCPPRIRGVALIVRNPRREILMLQELQTKPHIGKYTGMFSPPMETSLAGEPDQSALERLIDEELPGLAGHVRIENERRGVYRVVPRVWVGLYVGYVQSSLLPTPSKESREEIGGYFWALPEEALSFWLRQGAREMISDYSSSRKGVVCRQCCLPAYPR